MTETTFEIQLPASLLQLGLDKQEIQRHATEWLVLAFFTDDHISSGKAARLLHLTRIEFLDLLRKRGIAYVNYTADELAEELAAAQELKVEIVE